jgi:hypothetical protein
MESPRRAQQRQQGREQNPMQSAAQQIMSPLALLSVLYIRQRTVMATHGKALDHESLLLERQDFAADEAVADLGVVIDEVGDLRGPLTPAYELNWLAGAYPAVAHRHNRGALHARQYTRGRMREPSGGAKSPR